MGSESEEEEDEDEDEGLYSEEKDWLQYRITQEERDQILQDTFHNL